MGLCSKQHKLLMSEEETSSSDIRSLFTKHFTLNKILIQELLCLWINLVFNLLYDFFLFQYTHSYNSDMAGVIFYFSVQLKVPLHVKYISSRCFT